MVKLIRQIRFAVAPFADSVEIGANSYCAKPTANGLAFFFTLYVELAGNTNKDTGFIVNVADIDKVVRDKAICIFNDFVKNCLAPTPAVGGLAAAGTAVNGSFEDFGKLLSEVWQKIENDFLPARINSLTVELMPARKIAIREKGGGMLYFSEKFEFSASHTLWNDKFSDDENYRIFGKCANRCGHGHNYIVEVTVKKSGCLVPTPAVGVSLAAAGTAAMFSPHPCDGGFNPGDFERIVNEHFIAIVDHKNLNADVGYFAKVNPTVENIAEFGFKSLKDKFKPVELDSVTVWESDRTFCTYRID